MEKILRTNKETGVEYWIHFTPEAIELLKDELFKDKSIEDYVDSLFQIETEEQSKIYNQPIGTWMFDLTPEKFNDLKEEFSEHRLMTKDEFIEHFKAQGFELYKTEDLFAKNKRGSLITFKERVYEAPEQYKGMSVEDILKDISMEELKKISFTKEIDVCGIVIKSADDQSLVWYFDGKEIQGIILKYDEMTLCSDDSEFKF